MKVVGIFEAKTRFTALCDEVVRTGRPALVSKRGRPLVMLSPAPTSIDQARENILTEWTQWDADHPETDSEPDFPDVRKMRGTSKANPLAEA